MSSQAPSELLDEDLTQYSAPVRAAMKKGYRAGCSTLDIGRESAHIKDIGSNLEKALTYERVSAKPTSREMIGVATTFLSNVSNKGNLVLLMTVETEGMFEKYFPDHSRKIDWLDYAETTARGIVQKYPYLEKSTKIGPGSRRLGMVIQAAIEFTEESETEMVGDWNTDSEVLYLLATQWKGSDIEGLKGIVEEAKELRRIYESDIEDVAFGNPIIFALRGFKPTADSAIREWMKDNIKRGKPLAKASYDEILDHFTHSVWRSITDDSKLRYPRIQHVKESIREAFLAKANSMKCGIDAFWDVNIAPSDHTVRINAVQAATAPAGINALQATAATANKVTTRPNKWLVSAERMVRSFLITKRRRPELCTNCLGHHDLKMCTDVNEDPAQNFAVWYDPTFIEVTGKHLPAAAKENLKQIQQWEENKPAPKQ